MLGPAGFISSHRPVLQTDGGGGDAEQDGILRWRKNEGKIKEDEGLIQGSGGRLLVGHFLDHSLLAISQPQPPSYHKQGKPVEDYPDNPLFKGSLHYPGKEPGPHKKCHPHWANGETALENSCQLEWGTALKLEPRPLTFTP